jgi:magnesium transporter
MSMIECVLRPELNELIERKDWDGLRAVFSELSPPDVAEVMEVLLDTPGQEEGVIFRVLPRAQAAAVFSYLPLERQAQLVHQLSHESVHSIINAMTPDDRTRLLEELPDAATRRLLESLSPEELKSARELLGYPERTAGRYMTPRYVALRPEWTAREAIEQIRRSGRDKETLHVVYVVAADGSLIHDIKLGALVLADPETKVLDVPGETISIPATAPGDEVIGAFEKYDRVALPVVDSNGHMLGILTVDDVLEFAEKQATREMQKLGGSEALDAPYREVGLWPMLKKRGGWLAALFIGETLTATAMGHFEAEIARAAVVALFVPLIISSGGNSGSQATSIIIRSLALQELRLRDWWYVFRKEVLSGVLLGVFLGLVGFVRIALWYKLGWHNYDGHPYLMGLTVWASLVGVVMFGSVVGSMLPFLLRKLGFDPATASAPFVATLVDVTGLVIYFSVALAILHTTLLK